MSERTSIDELVDADLIVGSVYEGSQDSSLKFEPLYRLLKVANVGGFRPKKTVKGKPWEYAYVVLYSTGEKEEWPDNIDAEKALFTYFGDNKAPRDDWAKTPGNRILEQAFSKKGDQNDRRKTYPFFFFTIVPKTGHARFRGLAVPGHLSIESQEGLLIEERDSSDGIFLNYKAFFSLLNIPIVKREFINELLQGNSLGDAAPVPWRKWIETGEYDLLPASQIDLKRQSGASKTSRSVKQYQMIREAAESIEGIVSSKYILDFIDEKYPGTNRRSIQTVIRAFTVNNDKRIGPFPENQKARIYDRRYDVLYQPVQSRGKYELYDPKKHGEWVIAKTKRSASNPQGLEVKLARAGTASTAPKAIGGLKVGVGRHLSRARIEALIEAFRGFMSTYEGVQALKRRKVDEPNQVNDLLKKAIVAQRKGNWKVFLPLIYYGVLPSRKRKSDLGYDSPSAPSGTADLLARLRKQAGYKEPAIREQACRLANIMSDASSGRVKAVLQKSIDLENSPYAWGVRLGQITPSLFALDDRLMIVNKRVIQSFKQMSMNVLGKTVSLPTKLSNYQNTLDELSRFQSQLASSYDFHEVLDNHWLNLFFSKSFEWKFKAKRRYSSVARQMDPAKRKKIEQLAMNFAIKQEESQGRRCTDVSSTESYDILSTDQLGGDPKFVEVKGHSRNDRTAWLTRNEYNLALRERDKYILYIVYNLDTGKPSHRRIVNPLSKMKVEPKEILSYFLS